MKRASQRKQPRISDLPSATISVVDLASQRAFAITFYGVTESDLTTVGPSYGGAFVREALARRGLNPDGFMSSPFFVHLDGRNSPWL